MNIMRRSSCLVVNPITAYSYGFLLNFKKVGSGLRHNDDPGVKLGWCVMLVVAGPIVAQIEVFFSSDYL